jgi:hypothetical protein
MQDAQNKGENGGYSCGTRHHFSRLVKISLEAAHASDSWWYSRNASTKVKQAQFAHSRAARLIFERLE